MLLQSPEEFLQAHDDIGELLDQPSDQGQREADLRHRGYMIEVDLEPVVSHFLDGLGEEAEQPLLARRLVIERRQHQHPAASQIHRVLGQHDGVGERAGARAGHQLGSIQLARVDQLLQQLHALVEAQRVALAGGAERGESGAALRHQPLAVLHESLGIGAAVLAVGGENRGDDAREVRFLRHVRALARFAVGLRPASECRAV